MLNYLGYDTLHNTLECFKMIVLCFGMEEDDGIKHINAKCCVLTLMVNSLTIV